MVVVLIMSKLFSISWAQEWILTTLCLGLWHLLIISKSVELVLILLSEVGVLARNWFDSVGRSDLVGLMIRMVDFSSIWVGKLICSIRDRLLIVIIGWSYVRHWLSILLILGW